MTGQSQGATARPLPSDALDIFGGWDPALVAIPGWAWWYWFGVAAFLGLMFGSFFNVCIYRIPAARSIVNPPSHCYACGAMLAWHDNIPVLAYLRLRGCCRRCGSHFSARYMGVELLCCAMFALVYARFGPGWPTLFHLVFFSMLFIGIFTDIDHFILPDGITWGGAVFAVAAAGVMGLCAPVTADWALTRDLARALTGDIPPPGVASAPLAAWMPLPAALAGAAIGYGGLWLLGEFGRLLFRKEAMGMGDVKLFAFLGAYLGPLSCLWILFLSAAIALVVSGGMWAYHRVARGDEHECIELPADDGGPPIALKVPARTAAQFQTLPYGPYIAMAAMLVLTFSVEIDLVVREKLYLGPGPARPVQTSLFAWR